ncbi:MAG: kelch repeat-containing protein [Planctomycetota bacterium]
MRKILILALILMLSSFLFTSVNSCVGTSNDGDESGSSGELTMLAPSNLVVTAVSTSSITMSWIDNSQEIGFYVEHGTPSVTYSAVATLTANTTVYTHTGLAANTTHYYRIRAYNYVTTSAYSNEAGTLTSWDTTLADGTTPLSRSDHTALWASPFGMLVWGGWDGLNTVNTGAIYSPTANTWSNITLTGAPSSRTGHSVIWTGSKMIVWGGYTVESSATQSIDNCEANWTAATTTITTALDNVITKEGTSSVSITVPSSFDTGPIAYRDLPSPINISARTKVTFWIRASQNIQSGVLSFLLDNDAGCASALEDLTINTTLNAGAWTLVTLNFSNPALLTGVQSVGVKAISDPGAVTINIDYIEASGGGTTYYNDGGVYDPSGNSWSAVATTNAPDARSFHSAVWTGSVMIIWGGKSSSSFNKGGVYDPALNEWRTGFQLDNLRNGSHPNTPSARSKHTAFWTGSGIESWRNKMIIWGGDGGGTSGGIYDIALDIWTQMSTTNAPSQRWGFSSVWTGEGSNSYNKKIIVWGGYSGSAPLGDGGVYDPAANTWATLSTTNAPSARMYHSGVWTGSKMFIWGGDGVSQSGGVYDPVYAMWGPITTINAPSARLYHSGVWTGTDMIVWGGYNGISYFNSGGRYKVE